MRTLHPFLALVGSIGFGCEGEGSDTANEGDADTDTDTDTDTDGPTLKTETLVADWRIPVCDQDPDGTAVAPGVISNIYPFKGEEHLWTAVRLTPTSVDVPFTATELRYVMRDDKSLDDKVQCDPNLEHAIMLWTQPSSDDVLLPPAKPYTIAVPAGTAPKAARERIEDLSGAGIVVAPGDDLVVAVQMNGAFPNVTCPQACALSKPDTFPPGRVLWASQNEASPFKFVDLTMLIPELARYGLDYEVTGTYQ